MSNNENKNEKFNKEEWIKQKNEDRTKVFKMLDDATEELNNSDCFMNYLDIQSHFDRYSVSNAILVAYQLPEASKLEDSKTWHDAGAYIQKGEKSIFILEPGKEFKRKDGTTGILYNAKKVFDISQTNKKIPEPVKKNYNERDLIKCLAGYSTVPVELDGSLAAGSDVIYNNEKKKILLRPGLTAETVIRRLAKEIAFSNLDKENFARNDNEVIASSVSYIICVRFGVEPEKIPDSNGLFANKSTKDIRKDLNKVRFESNRMTLSLEKSFKELNKNHDRDVR